MGISHPFAAQAKRESDPAWFDGLLQSYVGLLARAEAALDAGDVAALGACLDENHALCQKLTVSCAELEDRKSVV